MKITTIGEVLIDMTEIGRDENGIPRFQANPGGAPANVAVAVAKLGGEAGFIGCVGEDAFGAFLRETLIRFGVDVHGLQTAKDASTTLAVVTVDDKGVTRPCIWPEMPTPTMASGATPDFSMTVFVVFAEAFHQSRGSCSAQPF